MATAFQPNAFQNNAFQIEETISSGWTYECPPDCGVTVYKRQMENHSYAQRMQQIVHEAAVRLGTKGGIASGRSRRR